MEVQLLFQQCNSWCCIARAHADAGHSFEDVISAYLAALQCAKDANSLSQQVCFQLCNASKTMLMKQLCKSESCHDRTVYSPVAN